jgi:hypothetical protein
MAVDADADAVDEELKEEAGGALDGGGTSRRDNNLSVLDDSMVCLRQDPSKIMVSWV